MRNGSSPGAVFPSNGIRAGIAGSPFGPNFPTSSAARAQSCGSFDLRRSIKSESSSAFAAGWTSTAAAARLTVEIKRLIHRTARILAKQEGDQDQGDDSERYLK